MSTMTVEQSHIEHIHTQRKTLLDQLKEITGVEDESILEQALQASRNEAGKFDLTQAVNILVDENAVRYPQQPTPQSNQQASVEQAVIQPQGTAEPVKTQAATKEAGTKSGGVIDLTNDGSEKEDLQRAIALSLQEQQHGMLGGQVTAEEQDISRVLEQSLAEAKAGTKRKRGEVWQDPLNPHERKRQHDWPVGLKNVGNTCWFSAVIQSLFHLPVFRHLVQNFMPPDITNEVSVTYSVEHRNLVFMQELRRLFSLMMCSQRKYVDPSKAVEILKEAFQSGSDSQQDVSEFTHKLLEWLEDAFKSDCSHPSPNCEQQENISVKHANPMLDLFYGQFRSEGHNEGHVFSNEETFGQYPLQVNGFSNIHESLEAATAQEIETTNLETVTKSGQEHWFTKLPPVLLFELSRFQFNQQLGRPEKIHNRFDFPEVIYMDRYMEMNKNITRTKREEVKMLKMRREEQQTKLEKYLNYGSGPKRVPLQDVLQYALEFVESKQDTPVSSSQDIDMASPCSNASMNVDSPCSSPVKGSLPEATAVVAPNNSASRPLTAGAEKPSTSTAFPCPLHVSDIELKVFQCCLKRWRTEVENHVRELQDSIGTMDKTISNMYNEASLHKVPYRLHAVLVHEGQAASGHYWAYVYNHICRMWLKFNDITVAESSWEELQKESFGGYHNASAYCLMYIDCNKKELVSNPVDNETGQRSVGIDSLPLDLRQLILEDNRRFQKEIEQWDQEQLRKKEEAARQDTECQIVDERKLNPIPGQVAAASNLPAEHAKIANAATLNALAKVGDTFNSKGAEAALNEGMMNELRRIRQLANDTNLFQDHRLEHIIVYVLLNNDDPPELLIRLFLLEQFAHVRDDDEKGFVHIIRKIAEQHLLKQTRTQKFHELKQLYLQYHEDYNIFRKTVAAFISGFEIFQKESYQDSLLYFINACIYNELLCGKYGRNHCGLDQRLLCYYRRQCLLHLNEIALSHFESEDTDEALSAMRIMNDLVVPCMIWLCSPDASQDDVTTAEEIRGKWCSKLGEEITSQKQEHLQEFLGKLLDPSADMKVRGSVTIYMPGGADFVRHFSQAMNKIRELGFFKLNILGR